MLFVFCRNEIARIEQQNALMLKRLQNAHAEYRTKDITSCMCSGPERASKML